MTTVCIKVIAAIILVPPLLAKKLSTAVTAKIICTVEDTELTLFLGGSLILY
jgi:hypothetical protein